MEAWTAAAVQYCAEFARDGQAVDAVLQLLRPMARSHPDVVRRHVLALAALAAGGFYSLAQQEAISHIQMTNHVTSIVRRITCVPYMVEF